MTDPDAGIGVVTDEDAMRLALAEAERAPRPGEVPVGAVVVFDGRVVGAGFNQPIAAVDPTAHAEVVALRAAARALGNYRLTGSLLYVTVEPCLMCVGAMIHARIAQVVFGAPEPRAGALVSACRAHETPGLNHRLQVSGRGAGGGVPAGDAGVFWGAEGEVAQSAVGGLQSLVAGGSVECSASSGAGGSYATGQFNAHDIRMREPHSEREEHG